MKKVILAAVVLGAISFTSCKKDYTCECTSSFTINGATTTSTYKYNLKESKKSAAYAVCEGKGIGSTTDEDGNTIDNSNTSCAIK